MPEYTDSEEYVWMVRYFGCLNGGQLPDEMHVVLVKPNDPGADAEEAIRIVKLFHDPHAVIERIAQKWLITADPAADDRRGTNVRLR